MPDSREIREWLERGSGSCSSTESMASSGFQTLDRPKRAVVVGGGYIGLEMAENLVHRGLDVTVVEMLDQVMAPLDPECALLVQRHMEKHGIHLALNDGVAGFRKTDRGSLEVMTKSGSVHPADIVILAIGVRPETELAKMAGIKLGERGGIRVDEHMRTSNPDIFAVGDAVEVKDFVTGEWSLIALAGPANRQGRIAADVICGRDSRFRGTQGTSIIGVFGATVASTGVNEKMLKRRGDKDYEKIYLFPNSHAGYYPGARMIALKVIFRTSDGRLLGAQALGLDGVDKRMNAFAMAIQAGFTIYDLEESELCYAPPFGSAKDPVNFAGMVGGTVIPVNTALLFPAIDTEGIGLFGQVGISDGNPNKLDWQALGGIGGTGLITGRSRDTWGIGVYYYSVSDVLKNSLKRDHLRDEKGIEIFYNAALTPWLTVGPDIQIIEPSMKQEQATFFGIRTVIKF